MYSPGCVIVIIPIFHQFEWPKLSQPTVIYFLDAIVSAFPSIQYIVGYVGGISGYFEIGLDILRYLSILICISRYFGVLLGTFGTFRLF